MSFDIKNIICQCLDEICKDFPEVSDVIHANYPQDLDYQNVVNSFKDTLQPFFMDIVQKNESMFNEPRFFLKEVDFSKLMKTESRKSQENLWNCLRMFLMCSYIGLDIMDTIKSLWTKFTGKTDTSEIDEILNEGTSKTKIQDLLETLKETRLFKIGMEVIETINLEKLGIDKVDFTNIEEIVEMIKNPEHPVTRKAISCVQGIIEEKMKKGSLRKEDFIAEIETLKEKFKHSLGKIFGERLLGDTGRETHSAQVMLSGHPDARRARMLARLQRKLNK